MRGLSRLLAPKLVRLVVIAGIATAAACAAFQATGSDTANAGDSEEPCGLSPVETPREWERYDDPFGRFSFEYPAAWPPPLEPSAPDEALSVFSYHEEVLDCVGWDSWAPGMAKIEVLQMEAGSPIPETAEEGALDGVPAHAEVWRADEPASQTMEETLSSELRATGLQVYAATYAARDDGVYVIAFYSGGGADEGIELFRHVLASWRWNASG